MDLLDNNKSSMRLGQSSPEAVGDCNMLFVIVRYTYVLGSNPIGTGTLHSAIALEVFLMVSLEILMYLRKQSLDHRPIPWMRYLGHPIAAAVDAAPIRREWEDILATPSDMSLSNLFMSVRVKKVPF